MNKKTKVTLIIIIALVVIIAGRFFFAEKELPYDFTEAKMGKLVQKVSVTGQVIPAKKIDLKFEVAGKIKDMEAEVGQAVQSGDVLAVLEREELWAQYQEAEAARDVAKGNLEKLLAGATEEEVQVYETAVANAEIALENARVSLNNSQQDLVDTIAKANSDLAQDYEDALDALDVNYTTADQALFKIFNDMQETYFYFTDWTSSQVRERENVAETYLLSANDSIEVAKENTSYENIDVALIELKLALDKIRDALSFIREAMDEPDYKNAVSATDRTSINTERSSIDTAITNIITSQQAIDSQRVTNQININSAQSDVDSAQNTVNTEQGDLKKAEDELTKIKAPPSQIEVDLTQAKLDQTEAALVQVTQKLAKASLRAPIWGIVTEIKKEAGETVAITDSVISLISSDPFQIEVDIPEVEVAKIELEDTVEIVLDAFSEEQFLGKVIEINPAETVIQGVVYYRVTVTFQEQDSKVKSGMTANIEIITETRENVLLVPQRAVSRKEGKDIVKVLEGTEVREIEVETGIQGNEGEIEILSGLKEGDQVVTFTKKK